MLVWTIIGKKAPDPFFSSNLNWARAVHGYETWHKATNSKCSGGWITADFTTYLRDVYDYRDDRAESDDKSLARGLSGLRPSKLKAMHRIGKMREFYVTGQN